MNRGFMPAAAFAALLLLTLAVMRGHTAGLDRMMLEAFAALHGPAPDGFFRAVTWLGSSYVLIPATILAMAALAARRQWAAARLLDLMYFGAALTTWLLKAVVGRERPEIFSAWVEIPLDGAYPSGHATHAAAFAIGLWLLMARYRPCWRVPAGIILSVMVLLVATSRLYLQVHWPSDVLAGLLVATMWAGLAYAGARHGQVAGRAT